MLKTFKKLPEKKQDAVLNAAARVFATKGYYRANVADICKRARISNGALYKYFKNKEAVYVSVLDRVVELFARVEQTHSDITKSVFVVLYDILQEAKVRAKTDADYIVAYLDLGSPSMSKFAPYLSDRIEDPSREFWANLIEEGKRRGEIDKNIDTDMAAYSIDNHVMLFMFAGVSPHYQRRFNSYFGRGRRKLTKDEEIEIIIESLRRLLARRK